MGNCCQFDQRAASRTDTKAMNSYIDEIVASPQPPAADKPQIGGALDVDLIAATQGEDFSFNGKRFLAKVVDVYDGDTLRVKFRHRGELVQYRARMAGYDSPEMKPPKSNANRDAEIEAAHAAKDALIRKINERNGDWMVFIECGVFDKYGRPLITMFTRSTGSYAANEPNGENINQWMMANGFGIAYDGKTKTPFQSGQNKSAGTLNETSN